MTHERLDAGIWGVAALLMACLACTSLQDLSSYSAGPSESTPPPDFQAPVPDAGGEPVAPPPDAGAAEQPADEAQNPTDVPLIPPDVVDAVDDCTGDDEFSEPDTDSCYRLADAAGSWRDARDLCQEWGGDLAKIDSIQENVLLAERSDEDAWIGASDIEDEGSFRWPDGDDVEGPWAAGQPDDFEAREDCVELRAMDDRWNDAPCTSVKVALCERTLEASEAP